MTFRLMGLPDELRLAIEQSGGDKTEEARLILEAAVNASVQQVDRSLREVQSIIGPHGSISRLQAGGVRITPGAGIGVYTDGVAKTNIQNNGTLVIGSDITDPRTTTEVFFTVDTVYNNEQFSAGDFLIGDNSAANVKYDASEGQLQFRGGTTIQAYIDTDGSIKAGGGDVTIDQWGVTFANQEGLLQFLDTNGGGTLALYSDGDNWLVLQNSFGGKGISFLLDDASHNVKQIDFDGDGNINLFNGVYKIGGTTVLSGSAWGAYTPTLTGITLGTGGTKASSYIQIGKTVHFKVAIVLGSSGFSVGAATVSLPVTAVSHETYHPGAMVTFVDASPTGVYEGMGVIGSTTTLTVYYRLIYGSTTVGDNLSSTAPFTWAAGDKILISGSYEAA